MEVLRLGQSVDVLRVGQSVDVLRVGQSVDVLRLGQSVDVLRLGRSVDVMHQGRSVLKWCRQRERVCVCAGGGRGGLCYKCTVSTHSGSTISSISNVRFRDSKNPQHEGF